MSAFERFHRAAQRHPHIVDVATALALFVMTLATTAAGWFHHHGTLSAGAVVAAGAAYSVLPFRRHCPWAVVFVAGAAAEMYTALSPSHVGVYAAPMIALYTMADSGSRRVHVAAGVTIVLLLVGVHALIMPSSWMGQDNLTLASLCGLAVAAGDASRNRRAYILEIEDRARLAASQHEREARRRVAEERMRIARDLHDVIGQRVVVIRMQADVVDHYFHDNPADARQALTHIKQQSRAALDDLRETVTLLRQPGEPSAPTEPIAGLAALPDLITRFTHSGMSVTLQTSGPVRTISPAADLTAYRVIQESLTNVSKHAVGAASTVNLSYGKASLRVTVDDDGKPAGLPRSGSRPALERRGHGIRGMQERVAAAGGYLEAGPRAGFPGFRVTAVLPLLQSAIAADGES